MRKKNTERESRPIPYPTKNESEEFYQAIIEFIRRGIQNRLSNLVRPENTQHYHHGTGWQHRSEDGTILPGDFEKRSSEFTIHFDEIRNHNIQALHSTIEGVIEDIGGQLACALFSLVDETAATVGNDVSVAETGSTAQAFIEMLKKVEFSVNSDGTVSMPSIYTHPDNAEKILRELESQGPEFEHQVQEIQRAKAYEALEKEAERRSKFKTRETSADSNG